MTKQQLTVNRCAALLVVLVFGIAGCSRQGDNAVPPQGDSISSLNGTGSGTVAGVGITVLGLESHTSAITSGVDVSETQDEARKSEHWDIDFGDVRIELRREDDGPISLAIDGSSYGSVEPGDQLLIDESGGVSVNGIERDSGAQAPRG